MDAIKRILAARETKQGAGIMFLSDQDTVLWVLRSDEGDAPNTWAFPGGGVEPGESLKEAALRECAEEIGFTDNVNMLKLNVQRYPDFEYHTFLGIVKSEFEPVLNDEHTDWQWLPLGTFPDNIHPGINKLKHDIEELA